jgi:hypothetical protein
MTYVTSYGGAVALILLFLTPAHAAGPALECQGVKSDNAHVRYELTVTALDANSVLVVDTAANEKCSCKFAQSDYFDQSRGMVPGYKIGLRYQSCESACPQSLKRQIKANIGVTYRLMSKEAYSTPFVGDEISNCDRFGMDLPALRKIAGQAIDRMDLPEDSRKRLKYLKGIED